LYLENTRKDKEQLRARHAALVEAAKEILPVTEDSWQRRKLKAALAEVMG
jgi:hypothetical protein